MVQPHSWRLCQSCSRLWYHAYVSTSPRCFLQEAHMAETEKEAYLALIAERDPEIRTLGPRL